MVLTRSGRASQLIAKYRPPCPVITVSDHDWVLRQASLTYGLYPMRVENVDPDNVREVLEGAITHSRCDAIGSAVCLGLVFRMHVVACSLQALGSGAPAAILMASTSRILHVLYNCTPSVPYGTAST